MALKKNIAVILAGGRGVRSGFDRPKQLVKLAGKPVIEHVLRTFQEHPSIHEVIVVSQQDSIAAIEAVVLQGRYAKVRSIISGGKERYESSLAAINASKSDSLNYDVNLIFHDAVRPLLSHRTLDLVIEALAKYSAIDVAIPTTDTIVEVNPTSQLITGVPDRARLRNGQTPQAFAYSVISRAYERALADPKFTTTDDCGVVLRYLPEEPIYVVQGESSNMKLTYEEDLHLLDKLCQLRSSSLGAKAVEPLGLSALQQKKILIIGGTSGIGASIAEIAAAFQCKVFSVGARQGFQVQDSQSVRNVLLNASEELGGIDYVVNCAGVLVKQPLVDMSESDILESTFVNYLGAINVARASFEFLRASRGQLLNFTSSSYTLGRAYYSVYSSTKAAVVNLTQALAEEWHAHSVRVNCINPERTATPMRTKAFGFEPPDTLLSADFVAKRALLVLLSDLTGQIVDIRRH